MIARIARARLVCLGLFLALLPAFAVQAAPSWTPVEAEILARWIELARNEAIDLKDGRESALRAAIKRGDSEKLDAASQTAAIELMRAWRGRCCGERRPGWWNIHGSMSDEELQSGLDHALRADMLHLYLRSIRPSHPHYAGLARAYANESDPARRAIIAKNLARWRWLPASLGDRYVLVNIAAQTMTLWERGQIVGEWRVIIGKPSTRTPVFTTQVTGVVFNPWWEIPPSIAAEGIARFVRRSPAAARARGYIYDNGRYRQMPGENNALGRVKLVMPNPYSVFLHDTSNRQLFAEDRRALSHGCIRVDRALEFAAVLLDDAAWNPAAIETQIATGDTRAVPLRASVPLYVTYFTAEPADDGNILFFEDIYHRDGVRLQGLGEAQAKGISGSQFTC